VEFLKQQKLARPGGGSMFAWGGSTPPVTGIVLKGQFMKIGKKSKKRAGQKKHLSLGARMVNAFGSLPDVQRREAIRQVESSIAISKALYFPEDKKGRLDFAAMLSQN